ncbi:MAG: hypothetical protein GC154_09240 [bacterium]|nr:hypothetical protein [bacterium]
MSQKMKPRRVVEAVVVLFVLGLLFAVSLPQFMNAQVSARAARSLKDLAAIAQAMEAYNLDSPKTTRLQFVFIPSDSTPESWRLSGNSFTYTINTGMSIGSSQAYIQSASFTPYLTEIPEPPAYYAMPQKIELAGRYYVADYGWRSQDYQMKFKAGFSMQIPGGPLNQPDWLRLEAKEPRPYVGIGWGPCLDARILHLDETIAHTNRRLSETDHPHYWVSYDPTNGIWSHGFAIHQSPPGKLMGRIQMLKSMAEDAPELKEYMEHRGRRDMELLFVDWPYPPRPGDPTPDVGGLFMPHMMRIQRGETPPAPVSESGPQPETPSAKP